MLNKLSSVKATHLGIFVAIAVLMTRLPFWLAGTFGLLNWEQIVYHLQSEATGVPWHLVRSSIRELMLKPVGAFVLTALIFWQVKLKFPSLFKYLTGIALVGCLFFMTGGVIQTLRVSGLDETIDEVSGKELKPDYDWMADMYSPPKIADSDPSNKRLNLIWIYVESLEESRVSEVKHSNLFSAKANISQFHNLPGTGWTIGGIVSSQCGLPLLPLGLFSGNTFSQLPNFMEGVTCIGDLLADSGYETTFIGGADTAFAGKEKFLKGHGFKQILGKKEIAARKGSLPAYDWWGFDDSTIYQISIQELQRIRSSKRPYFVNVLTSETHGPKGYLSKYCIEKGYSNAISSIFDCAVYQLQEFIDLLKSNGILEDTVLVISGDHPFMEPRELSLNPFSRKQPQSPRKIFFAIIRPDGTPLSTAVANHFDMFPTVMAAIKLDVTAGRAGLGRDLYKDINIENIYTEQEIKSRFRVPSPKYREVWSLNK